MNETPASNTNQPTQGVPSGQGIITTADAIDLLLMGRFSYATFVARNGDATILTGRYAHAREGMAIALRVAHSGLFELDELEGDELTVRVRPGITWAQAQAAADALGD